MRELWPTGPHCHMGAAVRGRVCGRPYCILRGLIVPADRDRIAYRIG